MTIIEAVGRRLYFVGLPFGAKDEAKNLGAKWDADRRQWWIGSSKINEATAFVARLNAGSAEAIRQRVQMRRLAAMVNLV